MYDLLPTITIDMRNVCSKSSAFSTIKALPFTINAQIKLPINDDNMFDYSLLMGASIHLLHRCHLNREVFKAELWIIRKQRSDHHRLLLRIIN